MLCSSYMYVRLDYCSFIMTDREKKREKEGMYRFQIDLNCCESTLFYFAIVKGRRSCADPKLSQNVWGGMLGRCPGWL